MREDVWIWLTWGSSAVGAVAALSIGNWMAAAFACNAAICAAGWALTLKRKGLT